MGEWKEYKLGEVADITSSKRIFYSEYVPEGVPFYRSKEVIDKFNKRNIQTELFISEEKFKAIKEKFGAPEKDDILLTSVGTLGIPYLVGEKDHFYFKDGNLTWFRKIEKDKVDAKYLFLWLQSAIGQQKLYEVTIGSTQPALTIAGLKEIEIELPDLPEQKSIASVLSSLDDKIDLLHRQNKTLEALAKTLFRQWFVPACRDVHGAGREEAEVGWETGKVDGVISVKGGTTPSTAKPEFWDGNINWTSPRDLSNASSIFMFDTERKITEKGLAQIGSGLLPIGMVLLSSRAPIGYLAITEIPVAINQGYIAIICNKVVSNYFIFLWCKANMNKIENAGNGSVFQEISKSSFRSLDFIIPPKDKLKAFDSVVEPLFQKIKSNTLQIRTITRLRDTLLPKLMSGEVRVKEEKDK
mgnify:CR=1 FL=1